MFDITVPETAIFARLYGLYLLAGGVGLLLGGGRYMRAMEQFRDNAALTYLGGAAAFAVGGATVALHNIWAGAPSIAISLIGWAALIEGAVMLAFPGPLMAAASALVRSRAAIFIFSAITILLGVWLLAAGFNAEF